MIMQAIYLHPLLSFSTVQQYQTKLDIIMISYDAMPELESSSTFFRLFPQTIKGEIIYFFACAAARRNLVLKGWQNRTIMSNI